MLFKITGEFDYKSAKLLASEIYNNPSAIEELMKIFYISDIRTIQRITWVITYCIEKNQKIIYPHLDKMINALNDDHDDAIKRNITRTLQFIDIPTKYLGRTFNSCYNLVSNAKTATAVKAFSMTVLYNICKREPELKNEVKDLIKLQLPHGSSGIVARARKIIVQLEKLN